MRSIRRLFFTYLLTQFSYNGTSHAQTFLLSFYLELTTRLFISSCLSTSLFISGQLGHDLHLVVGLVKPEVCREDAVVVLLEVCLGLIQVDLVVDGFRNVGVGVAVAGADGLVARVSGVGVVDRVVGLQLEELGDVVDEGKAEDGDDVVLGRPLVGQLVEGVAHRQVALHCDGHGEVDASGQANLYITSTCHFRILHFIGV